MSENSSSAPYPGSKQMPQWNVDTLVDAPRFTAKNWFALLGPGLIMGGAAVGGGEWLLGPIVTAKYGGALLWVATLSILGQVIYNIEISRYTLYCGEPIFTGKFRTLPGPHFWLIAYLIFDFGSVFPYLAANAATPLATIIKGGVVPDSTVSSDFWLMKGLAYAIFIFALIPLLFGGKIYRSLKAVMTFKLFTVFGFLLIVAFCFTSWDTWVEIGTGLFKFGTVPVERGEDLNQNNELDDGEDWDGDKRLDAVEPRLGSTDEFVKNGGWPDLNGDGIPDAPKDTDGDGALDTWGDLNNDGSPEPVSLDKEGKVLWPDLTGTGGKPDGKPDTFIDTDQDGFRDGNNVDNIFSAILEGRPLNMDFTLIAFIAGLAAIAGSGGLSNTPVSNYTRDQGWGMGHHVGAIPSVVGGHNIQLSHVGSVFIPNEESMPRWKRWYKHVLRDQLVVWMPACFIGLALPSMLSIQFLPRGVEADNWTAATMTAGGVYDAVSKTNASLGSLFWFMTLFCGFLVLAPSMATSADGIIRRWVDVFWTSSSYLRSIDPRHIKRVYFFTLFGYACFGLVTLSFSPGQLVQYATMIFNVALGFSCWHVLVINMTLLPKGLRPNWFLRIGLVLAGGYFATLGVITVYQKAGQLGLGIVSIIMVVSLGALIFVATRSRDKNEDNIPEVTS